MTTLPKRSKELAAIHEESDRRGAGVLVLCSSTGRFLLGKRGPICSQAETWAPFGGMVEAGESDAYAAARELKEEADVDVDVDSLVSLYANVDTTRRFTFATFLAVVPEEVLPVINAESSGYAWFSDVLDNPPQPAHPGFLELLADETVRAILSGALGALYRNRTSS